MTRTIDGPAGLACCSCMADTDLAKRSYCKCRNKKVTFASGFKDKVTQYIYIAVDKYGEKVVDKVKTKSSEDRISPYLRRPLRSFADVVAQRQAGAALAAEAEKAREVVNQNRDQEVPERLSA